MNQIETARSKCESIQRELAISIARLNILKDQQAKAEAECMEQFGTSIQDLPDYINSLQEYSVNYALRAAALIEDAESVLRGEKKVARPEG